MRSSSGSRRLRRRGRNLSYKGQESILVILQGAQDFGKLLDKPLEIRQPAATRNTCPAEQHEGSVLDGMQQVNRNFAPVCDERCAAFQGVMDGHFQSTQVAANH